MATDPMTDKIQMAAAQEDAITQASGPTGNYTKAALNLLAKAFTPVMTMFGITEPYPMFTADRTDLPTDFIALLEMVKAAVDDAIAADILSPDMGFDIPSLIDDRSLKMLAGRMDRISKDKAFKRWLTERPEETTIEESTEEVSEAPMEMNEDELFRSRI
jgi:hypothetical protein